MIARRNTGALPRALVLQGVQDAVAYPVGRYEKIPGLLKTGPQSDWHPEWRMIHSREEIVSFKGLIFSSDVPKKVIIDVNGKQRLMTGAVGTVPFEVTGFSAQALHYDWIYRITVNAGQNEVWALFEPVYQNDRLNREDSVVSFSKMPDVVWDPQKGACSAQEISFYKRSGTDLGLYSYLQRVYLRPVEEIQPIFLKRGSYRLRTTIAGNSRECSGPLLQGTVSFVSLEGNRQTAWMLASPSDTHDFEIATEYAMTNWKLDFVPEGSVQSWIEPDLAAYLNKNEPAAK